MPILNFDSVKFNNVKVNLYPVLTEMSSVSSKAESIKSLIPSDFSTRSSAISILNSIIDLGNKNSNIRSLFGEWEAALIEQYGESYFNGLDFAGAFYDEYGIPLDLLALKPGWNVISDTGRGTAGSIRIFIPENYDGSSEVGVNLFYANYSGEELERLMDKINGEEYDCDSIIIFAAEKSASAFMEGSYFDDSVMEANLEILTNIETLYNTGTVTISAASRTEPAAVKTALNYSEYIDEINLMSTFGGNGANYTEAETNNAFKIVESIQEASEKGVIVNLYCPFSGFEYLYEDYENINIIKTKAKMTAEDNPGHGSQMEAAFNNEEYLASIGVHEAGESAATAADTEIPEIETEDLEVPGENTVENDESTTEEELPEYTTEEIEQAIEDLNSGKDVEEVDPDLVEQNPEEDDPDPTPKPAPKPKPATAKTTNILPDNEFTDVLPEITTGNLDIIKIGSDYAIYSISGVNESTYENYLLSLTDAGYVLSEDGTYWFNDLYKIILAREETSLTISIYTNGGV